MSVLTLTAKRSHISGARYIWVVVFSMISSCVERSLEFVTGCGPRVAEPKSHSLHDPSLAISTFSS